jgi:AcrR family transcriptional regulator
MSAKTKKRPVGRPRDDERAAVRQEEILKAATAVFAVYGYPNTDVQAIADMVGVGKGTVYRYFPTKQDLFFAAVDRGLQRLQEQLKTVKVGISDPVEQMKASIRAFFKFFESNSELVELFIQERSEFKDRTRPTFLVYKDKNAEQGKETLSGLMSKGRMRKMDVESLLDFFVDAMYGMIFMHHFARREKPLSERAEDLIKIILNGTLTEAEQRKQTR